MRRVMRTWAAFVAILAIGAFGSSSASAAGEGPGWKVHLDRCTAVGVGESGTYETGPKCASAIEPGSFPGGWNYAELRLYRLGSGEGLPFSASGENVVLRSSGLEISCPTLHSEGEARGGSPGTALLRVVFSGCVVVGFPGCKVMSKPSKKETEEGATLPAWGTIELASKMELVYTATKAQAEKEEAPVGGLVAPRTGAKFVLLALEGSGCPVSGELSVEGSLAAKVTPGGGEEPLEEGHLTFAGPASTTTFGWESKGKVKEHKDGLKVFGEPAAIEGSGSVRALPHETLSEYELLKVALLTT